MKLNKLYYIFISFIILFSSCSNEIEENNTLKNETTTLKIQVQSSARTVLPQTVAPEELTDFLLTGKINNNTFYYCSGWNSDETFEHYNQNRDLYEFRRKYSSLSDLQNEKIKLIPADWEFTLTAKKGGTTYKAEKTQNIIQGENTISFNLTLDDTGQEKGAFSLSLDFSEADNANKVTSASASLQNIDGTAVTGFHTQTLSVSSGKVTYSEDHLPVGSYRALITLYSDNLELLTWREIIVISSDLVSSAERKLDSLNHIYTITYFLNDDEEHSAVFCSTVLENYTRKTQSFSIPTLSRSSYMFLGWFETEDCSGEAITIIDTSRLENIKLYAKWKSLFSDATLLSLSFSGNDVKIFDNEIQRHETTADVDKHEYYLEYKTLFVNAELTNSNASINLSNNNVEMKIDSIDSTRQDIILTITSEDNTSINSYLIHTVKVFNYEEACNLITTRTQALNVKIIDENKNINTVGSSISNPPTPSAIGIAINKKNYDVSIDLSSTSLTSIGNYAFSQCCALKEIQLPSSLNSIGESAFLNCKNLNEIHLPTSVKDIQTNAFALCSSIKTFIIPNKVSNINDNTFSGCSNLESVFIPRSVKSIGTKVFNNCTNIKDLVFEDTESTWYGSAVANFGTKHEIGKMISEDNIKKMLGYYNYYKIF